MDFFGKSMEKAASAVASHPSAPPRKSSAPGTTRPSGEPPDSALVRALSPAESQRNGCPGHSVASYRPGGSFVNTFGPFTIGFLRVHDFGEGVVSLPPKTRDPRNLTSDE